MTRDETDNSLIFPSSYAFYYSPSSSQAGDNSWGIFVGISTTIFVLIVLFMIRLYVKDSCLDQNTEKTTDQNASTIQAEEIEIPAASVVETLYTTSTQDIESGQAERYNTKHHNQKNDDIIRAEIVRA